MVSKKLIYTIQHSFTIFERQSELTGAYPCLGKKFVDFWRNYVGLNENRNTAI
jgi:hypothetical protein